MSDAHAHDIKVLNGLLETTTDSADGYRAAAEETDNSAYRALFERRAAERQGVADTLRAWVLALGGQPDSEGSILAKAHRAFLDIKSALLRTDEAVVGSVESGEDHLKSRFEKALADDRISATTRENVRRAFEIVRDGHDQMSQLKHSLKSQHDADSSLYPR